MLYSCIHLRKVGQIEISRKCVAGGSERLEACKTTKQFPCVVQLWVFAIGPQYVDFSLQQMQSAQSHTDLIRGIATKSSISPISKVFAQILFLFSLLAQIAPVNGALCFYGGMLSYQILAIKLKHFQENSSTFSHSIIGQNQ